jgi:hypothetical protein
MYPHNHVQKVFFFFFDEIQYVNRWAQFTNRIQTTENCEVYITGSSAKLLSKEIATELGGGPLPGSYSRSHSANSSGPTGSHNPYPISQAGMRSFAHLVNIWPKEECPNAWSCQRKP